LPDEGRELVTQPVAAALPEHHDLLGIGLEVRPDVVVDRDHHLGPQALGHAQQVAGGHLVGHPAWVLTVGAERHVDLIVVAVLGVPVRVVRVAAVIQAPAGRDEEVVHRGGVHVLHAVALERHALRRGHQHGAVEGVEDPDLDVLDRDGVSGPDDDAALFGYAPAGPEVDAGLWPDERDRRLAVLQHGRGDVGVDVVAVVVGGQERVELAYRERIDRAHCVAQVRLQRLGADRPPVLVVRRHLAHALGRLAALDPEVGAEVGAAFALEPDAGAAEPPHGEGAGCDDGLLDLLVEPGPPFREVGEDPRLAGDGLDSAHASVPSTCR
jgi:hypothetical protein